MLSKLYWERSSNYYYIEENMCSNETEQIDYGGGGDIA